jgi:hypothetical protein
MSVPDYRAVTTHQLGGDRGHLSLLNELRKFNFSVYGVDGWFNTTPINSVFQSMDLL